MQRDVRRGVEALGQAVRRRIAAVLCAFGLTALIAPMWKVLLLLCIYLTCEWRLSRMHARVPDRITWRFAIPWVLMVELCNLSFGMLGVLILWSGGVAATSLGALIMAATVLHAIAIKAVSSLLGLSALVAPSVCAVVAVFLIYDGSLHWYALVVGLVTALVFCAMTIRSIARTHARLNTALRRANAASDAKSRFLAAMSHEVRTPLNAIIGLAEVIASRPPGPSDRDDIQIMLSSGLHLKAMLDDVLDHAKLSQGEMTFHYAPHDVASLCRDTLALFRGRIAQKGLVAHLDIAPDVPGQIVCDATRLRQILSNLLSNAVKFTDAGHIKIRVSWYQAPNAAEGRLHVSVLDTGCGIEEAAQAGLFKDFAQADADAERAADGTGLGLAIARELAVGMGGDLTVVSACGHGARFTLRLPGAPAAAPRRRAAEPPCLTGWSILIVDDSAVNRMVVRRLLEPTGATLLEAPDGAAALDHIGQASGPTDLVLLDMNMPVLDGPGFLQALHLQPHDTIRPKVVILTANSEDGVLDKIDPERFDDFLAKPLSRALLFDTLAGLGIAAPKPALQKT